MRGCHSETAFCAAAAAARNRSRTTGRIAAAYNAMQQPLALQLATPVRLLVLIGGGEFSFGETREIDEFLVRNMPADRKTIAFLPTASGSAEYAVHLGNYFKTIDPAIATINV